MAKDFDRHDEWAPDSSLDSDPMDPGVDYTIAEGRIVNVKTNDWIDCDDVVQGDPFWGSSKQVLETHEMEVVVRMYDPVSDLFYPAAISPELIVNNYRRVPNA